MMLYCCAWYARIDDTDFAECQEKAYTQLDVPADQLGFVLAASEYTQQSVVGNPVRWYAVSIFMTLPLHCSIVWFHGIATKLPRFPQDIPGRCPVVMDKSSRPLSRCGGWKRKISAYIARPFDSKNIDVLYS